MNIKNPFISIAIFILLLGGLVAGANSDHAFIQYLIVLFGLGVLVFAAYISLPLIAVGIQDRVWKNKNPELPDEETDEENPLDLQTAPPSTEENS